MAPLDDEDFLDPPSAARGFAASAEDMLLGAETLYRVEPERLFAITHLCGHAVEASLKACLSALGHEERRLAAPSVGHDLNALWLLAAESDSLIPKPPPDWLGQLSRVHLRPYVIRYPTRVHAVILPAPAAMVQGARDLFGRTMVIVGRA